MKDEAPSMLSGVKVIKRLRDAMIFYSFAPILFMAVNFFVYMQFSGLMSERYACYSMTLLSAILMAFTILLMVDKRLKFGYVAQCGLGVTVIALMIGIGVWWLNMSPNYALLAVAFYILGQIAFAIGSNVGVALKVVNVAFYCVILVSGFIGWDTQAVVAVVAMSIVAYPMIVSYLAVRWASAEFFKLSNDGK